MRVNVYAEEMPDDVAQAIEIHHKEIEGQVFTGLRIYLHMPVTRNVINGNQTTLEASAKLSETDFFQHHEQVKGPFIHHPGDDDSSAVTFWGKKDLREVLKAAIAKLDEHYAAKVIQYGSKK